MRRYIDQLRQRFPANADCQAALAEPREFERIPKSTSEFKAPPQTSDTDPVPAEDVGEPSTPSPVEIPEVPAAEATAAAAPQTQASLRRSMRIRMVPKYLEDYVQAIVCSYLRGEGCNVCGIESIEDSVLEAVGKDCIQICGVQLV